MAESSQDLEQQCVAAFKQGNHDQAVQLLPQLQQPGDVTTEFKLYGKRELLNRDVTLLHLAAYHDWLDIIKTVQQHVLMYDCRDSEGLTPLHYAAITRNSFAVIDYLIKTLGCDPNAKTTRQNLPLHVACRHGHLNSAKYFITEQNSCDPNVQGNNGSTPLHFASQGGHMNIIQYLITELGCDPTIPDSNGSLPLHIACLNGHLNATKYFFTKQNCDPNVRGYNGFTPLHYASQCDHMNIIQYQITELGCDPAISNNNGSLPLHIACLNGHLSATKYFITEQNCDPNNQGQHGFTPLHFASQGGHMNIIQYLITELGCDPTTPDSYDNLPLHIACANGHLNAAKYFIIEQNCDPDSRDHHGFTPLHYASQGGHMNIIRYLITELGCDPTTPDSYGSLPLHIACLNDHLNAAKYFIAEKNCDPNSRNNNGFTPLHFAFEGGHMNIIEYLVTKLGCDPSMADGNGRTGLHLVIYHGHAHIVEWLLHDGQVNIMAKDNSKKTCIDLLWKKRNSYKLLTSLVKTMKDFPIHTFSKTVLTGNHTTGKTALVKIITKQTSSVQVETLHTAGIVPSLIQSKQVGKMVLFDLAGQAEYHSSHSAVMETVMQQSPATFINVIDLSNTDAEIAQQLHYWLNFINDSTSKNTIKSSLIVVGSHFHPLRHEQLQRKCTLIVNTMQEKLERQEYMGFVAVDCHKINSAATRKFISLLYKSHQAIVDRSPSMSYYCHLLYAFLNSKLDTYVCTLEELISLLAQNDSLIPLQATFIAELLTTLSGRGLIIYLKNQQQLEESWIVVDTESLLKKVNEVLFISKYFIEHQKISNTGIVLSSTLKQLFPQFNLDMLVGYLQTLELCHNVHLSGIETNLLSIETFSYRNGEQDSFLFFPSFLNVHRTASNMISLKEDCSFGWCLYCKATGKDYFTSQFLHVLLLRLAYTFPLTSETSTTHLHRKCTLWTNGISWDNEEGIKTAVELIDHNQCVMVVMSHKSRPVVFCKHRSAVIRLILDLQQQLCPNIVTAEYLTSPSFLRKWSSTESACLPSKSDLLPIENVANSMLRRRPFILTSAGIISDFHTNEILKYEPYYQLSPSSVCELMDSSKADEPVPQSLLREVENICQVKQLEQPSHSFLRKEIDELSIFVGKNLIVSNNTLIIMRCMTTIIFCTGYWKF